MAAVTLSFSYDSLSSESRIVVQQRTGEIKDLMNTTAQSIIRIGQKLTEVKDQLDHGQFQRWLKCEFSWSHDTANRFMLVARKFGESPSVAQFAPSALYLLAAPATPPAAVKEATTRASQGEPISRKTAQDIVDKHQPKNGAAPKKPGRLTLSNRVYQFLARNGPLTFDQLFDGMVQQGFVSRSDANKLDVKAAVVGLLQSGGIPDDWITLEEEEEENPPDVIILDKEEKKTPQPQLRNDSRGIPIPGHLQPIFDLLLPSFKTMRQLLIDMRTEWGRLEDLSRQYPSAKWFKGYISVKNDLEHEIPRLIRNLHDAIPYTTCPYCKLKDQNCRACQGSGVVTQHQYQQSPGVLKKGGMTVTELNESEKIQA